MRWQLPHLTEDEIVEWAKNHFARTGRWPSSGAGPLTEKPTETWGKINMALRIGYRGLPGGDSLPALLRRRVGKTGLMYKPHVSREQIIVWAQDHFSRFGRWPYSRSGQVAAAPSEKWLGLDTALRFGMRGLPGGSSLSELLNEVVGPAHRLKKPRVKIAQIVEWARQHHARTGSWPTYASGPVQGAAGETWTGLASALQNGTRGLPGGDTLGNVLQRYVGKKPGRHWMPLSHALILRNADAFHRKHNRWPSSKSGPVDCNAALTWRTIDNDLKKGIRGLPGGESLAKLLVAKRGESPYYPARLRAEKIVTWAKAHHRRTGHWPHIWSAWDKKAMPVRWAAVHRQLKRGRVPGVPAGTLLTDFLSKQLGVEIHPVSNERLSIEQILKWADDHHRRTGYWPLVESGQVIGGPEHLTWRRIHAALKSGGRGLPKSGSLTRLLFQCRGVRHPSHLPRLTINQVLEWADAFFEQHGDWPAATSGDIPATNGENWRSVDHALRRGIRGLPGDDSLPGLLARRRGLRRTGYIPKLSTEKILSWAVAHHRRTGRWPWKRTGPILESPDESWNTINGALRHGHRGLPKGLSLSKLLNTIRGESGDLARKRSLKLADVELWAKAYCRRAGRWPDKYDGRIADAKGETWFGIDEALQKGMRGLPKSSLRKLTTRLKRPRRVRLKYVGRPAVRIV